VISGFKFQEENGRKQAGISRVDDGVVDPNGISLLIAIYSI
jgi:hypothetical protein